MTTPDTAAGEAAIGRAVVEAVVRNPQGIHLRPATRIVQHVEASGCSVLVEMGDARANGSSVLELALMAIGPGSRLRVTVEGEEASLLAAELVALIEAPAPD